MEEEEEEEEEPQTYANQWAAHLHSLARMHTLQWSLLATWPELRLNPFG